jgi:hypothetical protein
MDIHPASARPDQSIKVIMDVQQALRNGQWTSNQARSASGRPTSAGGHPTSPDSIREVVSGRPT